MKMALTVAVAVRVMRWSSMANFKWENAFFSLAADTPTRRDEAIACDVW
jgi:hypothetical protein